MHYHRLLLLHLQNQFCSISVIIWVIKIKIMIKREITLSFFSQEQFDN